MTSRIGRSGYLAWARAGWGSSARSGITAMPRASKSRRLMGRPSSRWCAELATACASGRPLLAFDLGAMHDPPAGRIESVAPVHGAAVIPQNEIADAPSVLPCELRPSDEAPEFVEQRLRLGNLEPDQIGVTTAPEIEHAPAGVRMRADQRMHRTWRGGRVVGRGHALTHIAAAVIGPVMLDLEAGDVILQRLRQRLVDAVHRTKLGIAAGGRHFEGVEHARHR